MQNLETTLPMKGQRVATCFRILLSRFSQPKQQGHLKGLRLAKGKIPVPIRRHGRPKEKHIHWVESSHLPAPSNFPEACEPAQMPGNFAPVFCDACPTELVFPPSH